MGLERDHLIETARAVDRRGRRRVIVLGVVLTIAHVLLTTVVLLIAARVTSRESQRLADRVDRNVAFTACVLSIDPDQRTDGRIAECLSRANARYGTPPPPPPTIEITLASAAVDERKGQSVSDLEMWAYIVGVFMPVVVAFFQQPGWSDATRAIAAAVICSIAGFVTVYLEGSVHSGRQLVTTALIVTVSAIATYNGFWKRTTLVPWIEHATAIGND